MEKVGIEESKEMIVAMMELAGCIVEVFKDGAQLSDVAELWSKLSEDEEVKAKMLKAYDGYQKIPAELKDLDVAEMMEVASTVMLLIPGLLDSFDPKRKEKDKEKGKK